MNGIDDILIRQSKKYSEAEAVDEHLNNIQYKIPDILFSMGKTALLKKKKIAIVGSRLPDTYGLAMTEKIIKRISTDYVTVSGFARGIDTAVHQFSIDNNLGTIGVLGCGFSVNYPSSNAKLRKEMIDRALLITEYGPFVKPRRLNFTSRNQIITYISDIVIIIQGGNRSGTINTLNNAIKMKKRIFALPGPINNKLSFAPNYAISRGAEIITTLDSLDFCNTSTKTVDIDSSEREILQMIEQGMDIDGIMRKSLFTNKKLFSILISLEMKGIIVKSVNNTYELLEDINEGSDTED